MKREQLHHVLVSLLLVDFGVHELTLLVNHLDRVADAVDRSLDSLLAHLHIELVLENVGHFTKCEVAVVLQPLYEQFLHRLGHALVPEPAATGKRCDPVVRSCGVVDPPPRCLVRHVERDGDELPLLPARGGVEDPLLVLEAGRHVA